MKLIHYILDFLGIGRTNKPKVPRRKPIFDDVEAWLRETEEFFDE